MGKGGRCSINPLARKRAREYDDDVLQGQGGGGEEEEPDTDQDMLDRSQVEDMEKQEEKEEELAGSGWISQLGRAWALSAALDRQMDVSVETAFIACCVRTRKGGLARLSPLERRMVESFKILLWGYVAQTSRLSMRHLKIDAAIDDLVRQNAAEQAAIDDLSANDDSGEGWSGGDKLGDVGKLKGGKRSSGKGSSGKGSSGKGSSGKTADGGAADGGDLSNVNLADGLVVDGYQFLIRHLASEPLADGSIPIGPVVGAPRGAAINDGEDEDSLHLRRTASSYHLDVRLGAAVREIRQGKDGASVVLADGTVEPCDMVVVTVPLGVLKRGASTGGIDFVPPLCEAKRCAIDSLGMGTENKVALRWPVADIFWPRDQPYMQCTDPRFRFLNGDYFGKAGVLVVLVAPPYAQEMESLEDEAIVTDILELLRGAFTPGRTRLPPVAEAHVTRWGRDPHSFGSYSYDQVGSLLSHRHALRAAEAAPGCVVPRIFFAGEACSYDAPQCVHGAVETGYMAADELLRSLTVISCADDEGLQGALQGSLGEEDSLIVCKCRSVFDPRRVMVRCKGCGKRFHDECVGVLQHGDDDGADEHAAALNAVAAERFLCVSCSTNDVA